MSTRGPLYSTDLKTWLIVDGDVATIGFSSYSCDRMEEMVAVELMQPGQEIVQGEPCGSVDVMKALVDIPAPISGVILELNQQVFENPDISRDDPFGEGWLMKVRIGEPSQLEGLMSAEEYAARTAGK